MLLLLKLQRRPTSRYSLGSFGVDAGSGEALFLVDLLDFELGVSLVLSLFFALDLSDFFSAASSDFVFLLSRSNCLADSVPDSSFGVFLVSALGDAFGLGGANVGSGAAACVLGAGVSDGFTGALATGVADVATVGLAAMLGLAATLALGEAATVGAAVALVEAFVLVVVLGLVVVLVTPTLVSALKRGAAMP